MIDSNGSISWGAPIILIILISHNWVFPRVRNICSFMLQPWSLSPHTTTWPGPTRGETWAPGLASQDPGPIWSLNTRDLFRIYFQLNDRNWNHIVIDRIPFQLKREGNMLQQTRSTFDFPLSDLRYRVAPSLLETSLVSSLKVLLLSVSICQADQGSLPLFSELPSLMEIPQSSVLL